MPIINLPINPTGPPAGSTTTAPSPTATVASATAPSPIPPTPPTPPLGSGSTNPHGMSWKQITWRVFWATVIIVVSIFGWQMSPESWKTAAYKMIVERYGSLLLDLGLLLIFLVAGLYLLAKKSIFFGLVPQGEIVTIKIGESAKKFLGNLPGATIDAETGEISDLHSGQKNDRSLLNHMLGIYWLGVWPFAQVYWRRHRKNNWNKTAGTGSSAYVEEPMDEQVGTLYYVEAWAITSAAAETSDRLPVTVKTVVTTMITNANKALFIADLTTHVHSVSLACLRDFVGKTELARLTTMPHNTGDQADFSQAMQSRNQFTNGQYGFKVISADFLSYELVGTAAAAHETATTAAYTAEQTAVATRSVGSAEADVIRQKGTANAKAFELQIAALGSHPNGAALVMAKAIENTGVTTLILGQQGTPAMVNTGSGGTNPNRRQPAPTAANGPQQQGTP